jgi:hypothetical protein
VLAHPLHRLVTWVEACFSVKAQVRGGDSMEACLMDLRTRSPLCIRAQAQAQGLQVTEAASQRAYGSWRRLAAAGALTAAVMPRVWQ